jgi:hypothetical protein
MSNHFLAVIEFVQVQSQLKVDLSKVDAVLWTIYLAFIKKQVSKKTTQLQFTKLYNFFVI